MNASPLSLVLLSTPIGCLGSGRGGGVELTLISLVQGLINRGHRLTLVAPRGSRLPDACSSVELVLVDGEDQPSWQHAPAESAVVIPRQGVLPRLLQAALQRADDADALLNFGYDWLPFWMTPFLHTPLFHLVSMGAVNGVMGDVIEAVGRWDQRRLAFHTLHQAADFQLAAPPRVLGNGFDLNDYSFCSEHGGPLGGLGALRPRKGWKMPLPPLRPSGIVCLSGDFLRIMPTPNASRQGSRLERSSGAASSYIAAAERAGALSGSDQHPEVERGIRQCRR